MKKVTYQQIADALNTSRVTVWKALNDKPGVSPATKRTILMKAVEMGYPISLMDAQDQELAAAGTASGTRRPETIHVAVAVSRPETSMFWMSIIHYQAMTFSQNDINLIYTYLPPTFSEGDTLPECLTNGTVSGIIVMNIYDSNLIRALNKLPIEKVFLDCPTELDFSELNGDLFLLEGISPVEQIVDAMVRKGKRRIHFIGDIAYAQTNRERYLGYLRSMQRNQLDTDFLPSLTNPIGIDAYQETIVSFLDGLKPFPEGIVCASDHIASIVLDYCQQHQLRVPEDVLVSGYDDNHEFDNRVPLTTVHVNNDRLGIRLATRLIHRIQNPQDDYEYTYIRNKAIFRSSTGD